VAEIQFINGARRFIYLAGDRAYLYTTAAG
jgi:hypothetical protein